MCIVFCRDEALLKCASEQATPQLNIHIEQPRRALLTSLSVLLRPATQRALPCAPTSAPRMHVQGPDGRQPTVTYLVSSRPWLTLRLQLLPQQLLPQLLPEGLAVQPGPHQAPQSGWCIATGYSRCARTSLITNKASENVLMQKLRCPPMESRQNTCIVMVFEWERDAR